MRVWSQRDVLLPLVAGCIVLWAAGATRGAAPASAPPVVLPPPVAAPTPSAFAAQIEADWELQDTKRTVSYGGATPGGATKEEDAAGGVDGLINGQWGFHTATEKNPWWQVDLGATTAIDRLVLYNRCDFAQRNDRIIVWLSDDGKQFRKAYQHNGRAFYGHTDKKPLVVKLAGAKARYVRLGVEATDYFHLDEVQAYAVGGEKNIALGKPATQSSISQWSERHGKTAMLPVGDYSIVKIVERGRKLAAYVRQLGGNVDAPLAELESAANAAKQLAANAPAPLRKAVYSRAHWAVRKIALASPLLDFDRILFTKSAPPRFPHQSDQFMGWWSRPGGGICVLEDYKSGAPRVRCLTTGWAPGTFLRPDLSYDGRRVLFTYCKFYPHVPDLPNKAEKANLPEDAFYHIFEMNLDGSGVRQLTRGRYDDFDARYLPDGRIAFLSTRKGVFLQVTAANGLATMQADLPDSYVRCGGDNYRPVPVFTLHAMNGDGGNVHPISAFENFEWTPSVAADGRILYTRWDYIDRFNGHFFSLWSTNPDGTNPQLVYGNYTVRPQVVNEAVAIPNSHKLLAIAAAHHSNLGGSLILIDRTRGTEESAPITRLTPEVPYPETEAWADHYYTTPWALSEEQYLVSWSDKKLPPHTRVDDAVNNPVNGMGIYLFDAMGNQELLHRDPSISSNSPIPIRLRMRPPAYAGVAAETRPEPQEGKFLLQDVYEGLVGVPRGAIASLRVIGVPPKVQPHMNTPNLGVSSEDPGKFVIGTVPVESDGSAFFRVPSGVPLIFQALDRQGNAVQTMRSLTYLQPKQTLSCIGCHEPRDAAPRSSKYPLAAMREASRLTPGPSGSWPLRFDRLVQPALDRQCVECHRPGYKDAKAARFDLTPAQSYANLLAYGGNDIKSIAFEKDRSVPGKGFAASSKLMILLTRPEGHAGMKLDADAAERLTLWIDTYAHRQGSFSEKQERELERFREQIRDLLTTGQTAAR